jgi:hypothetical protein
MADDEEPTGTIEERLAVRYLCQQLVQKKTKRKKGGTPPQ